MSCSSIGKCNLLKSGGHTQLTQVGDASQAKRPAGLSDAEESLADGEGHRSGPDGDNVERGGVNPNPHTPGRDA